MLIFSGARIHDSCILDSHAIHFATKECKNLRAFFNSLVILVYVPYCEKGYNDHIRCCGCTFQIFAHLGCGMDCVTVSYAGVAGLSPTGKEREFCRFSLFYNSSFHRICTSFEYENNHCQFPLTEITSPILNFIGNPWYMYIGARSIIFKFSLPILPGLGHELFSTSSTKICGILSSLCFTFSLF